MNSLKIHGGRPIVGAVSPSGNSNLTLALIAASLLPNEEVILSNVPNTSRVDALIRCVRSLGAQVERKGERQISIKLSDLKSAVIDTTMTRSVSYAFLLLAPILALEGRVTVELDFSPARLVTHIQMLEVLGYSCSVRNNMLILEKREKQPRDLRNLWLRETSVSATMLALILSARLPARTTIYNAASEPHVQDLARFLVQMGASIEGIGSNLLTVQGKERLAGTEFRVSTDHIEAASWLGVAAMTRGSISVAIDYSDRMELILRTFQILGLETRVSNNALMYTPEDLVIRDSLDGSMIEIKASPWPGFPSDLASLFATVATQAQGSLLVHDPLYANRMNFVDELKFMGAQLVYCDPHRVIVNGPSKLTATVLTAPDVRVGFSLVAAALTAKGTSVIGFPEHLDNVFEGIIPKLSNLGADIEVNTDN